MKKIIEKINKLREKGFFQIIISTTLTKMVSFISAMFLPRFLSVEDYGILAYSENILSYILIANGLGMTNTTLKYCTMTDSEEEKKDLLKITSIIGILFDLLVFIFWEIFIINTNLKYNNSKQYLVIIGLIPLITFCFENIQSYLRATFQNTKYMIISVGYSILFIIIQILFTIKIGLLGNAIAKYIVIITFVIISIKMSKIDFKKIEMKVNIEKIKEFIKFGFNLMIGNVVSMIISLNEITIVSKVFNNIELIAQYKVGAYILPIALFLTNSIVIFLIPYFAQKANDIRWIWDKFKKVFKYNFILMLIIHIFLYIISDVFIKVFFGDQYIEAIPIMKTLLIASLIQSVLKAIPGNILTFIGKERFNLVINIISLFIHIIVEYFLLRNYGIQYIGVGLIISYLLSGLIMYLYLIYICKKGMKNERFNK